MGMAVRQRRWMAALIVLGSSAAHAQEETPGLPALAAASDQASVVGVSSGGYMATQLAVACPERFSGLGVLAAGPWGCAQGALSTALNQCMMTRRGLPSLDELEQRRQRYAEMEQVGSQEALRSLRAFVWHGTSDETVSPALGDLLAQQNPTCNSRQYSGGLSCCGHRRILLDTDQDPGDELLRYHMKFRFWFQEYEQGEPIKGAFAYRRVRSLPLSRA